MFKNEKGLTLIELLITIAVIAVVAAISVPVVSNVIAASNTNSLSAMQEQVDQFVAEAAESGTVRLSVDGTRLEALIDQNGDGVDEYLVKTFPFDSKYTVTENAGVYTVSAGTGATVPAGYTYNFVARYIEGENGGDFGSSGSCNVVGWTAPANDISFYCNPLPSVIQAFSTLEVGDPIEITFRNFSTGVDETITVTYSSQDTSQSPVRIFISGASLPQGELKAMSF